MEHVLVADTNLFFECKRLEELPWSDLAVDPVVIALTKPVLAEIDKHKKGGGRTRKRAIEISGRIRAMLAALPPEVVIQEAGPRVLLRLMPIVQPAPELARSLDYSINDDRIVGTVATLSKDETFASVKMLTDDSVAASTAQGLGVSFFLIPESWKRPPEQTTEAKRIKELEKDLSIYRSQEPVISIANVSGEATATNVVRRIALALEPSEIDRLIDKLKARHPQRRISLLRKPRFRPMEPKFPTKRRMLKPSGNTRPTPTQNGSTRAAQSLNRCIRAASNLRPKWR